MIRACKRRKFNNIRQEVFKRQGVREEEPKILRNCRKGNFITIVQTESSLVCSSRRDLAAILLLIIIALNSVLALSLSFCLCPSPSLSIASILSFQFARLLFVLLRFVSSVMYVPPFHSAVPLVPTPPVLLTCEPWLESRLLSPLRYNPLWRRFSLTGSLPGLTKLATKHTYTYLSTVDYRGGSRAGTTTRTPANPSERRARTRI